MHSYWEKKHFVGDADLVVIGCGIVGLSAAISLKESKPQLKIQILEKGYLPSGASTKNAGFACFGSLSELLDDINFIGLDATLDLVKRRYVGLQILRSRVGDEQLNYEELGGYEVFREEDDALYLDCISNLTRINSLLEKTIGIHEIFVPADEKLVELGLTAFKHLIKNRIEGQIDAGSMMLALIRRARNLEIDILFGTEVEQLNTSENAQVLILKDGTNLKPKHTLVATNGFARQLLPELDVRPARNQVLVTSVCTNLKINGAFHLDRGYYYFRNIDGRILLGGGRHHGGQVEETSEEGITTSVQQDLEQLLFKYITPHETPKIEFRWSGTLGLGPYKSPIIKNLQPGLSVAVRMGGMGVALGSLVGKEAAEMIDQHL